MTGGGELFQHAREATHIDRVGGKIAAEQQVTGPVFREDPQDSGEALPVGRPVAVVEVRRKRQPLSYGRGMRRTDAVGHGADRLMPFYLHAGIALQQTPAFQPFRMGNGQGEIELVKFRTQASSSATISGESGRTAISLYWRLPSLNSEPTFRFRTALPRRVR